MKTFPSQTKINSKTVKFVSLWQNKYEQARNKAQRNTLSRFFLAKAPSKEGETTPFPYSFATLSPLHHRYISYISPIYLLYISYIPAISNRRNIGGIYDIHRRWIGGIAEEERMWSLDIVNLFRSHGGIFGICKGRRFPHKYTTRRKFRKKA